MNKILGLALFYLGFFIGSFDLLLTKILDENFPVDITAHCIFSMVAGVGLYVISKDEKND